MQAVNVPALLPMPWAADADPSTVRDIPTNSQIGIQNGAASLHDGFPPLTMTAEGSGGVPPFGKDANGILRWSTEILQWYQAGGPVVFDSAFCTAIGGYPKGTVLQSNALNGVFWRCTADSNTTNPDAIGATNWVSFFAPVFANPTFTGTSTFNGPVVMGSTVNLGTAAIATTQAQNDNTLRVATTQYVDRQAATTAANAAADATAKANAAQTAAINYANATFATPSYVNAQASAAQTNAINYANATFATPSYVNAQASAAQTNAQAYTDNKFSLNGGGTMYLGGFWIMWGSFTATANSSGTQSFPATFPTACVGVVCQPTGNPGTNNSFAAAVASTSSFNWNWASTAGGSATTYFFAWGY